MNTKNKESEYKALRTIVYAYYKTSVRDLPWRKSVTPYTTFVSEIMLQQTQVDRVSPFYVRFIKAFPDFKSLARAPLQKVLSLWQGLGYNRRALYLKRAAEIIVKTFNGILPRSPEILATLPGIGKATAASIAAFGYNYPSVFLETNIRTVLIHHFFPAKEKVTDEDLMTIAAAVLDRKNPAEWYSALMDYGTMLKKQHGNASVKSAHYTKQSKFEGSQRQIRGKIVKALLAGKTFSVIQIGKTINSSDLRQLKEILDTMAKEHLVKKSGNSYAIPAR